ncbi:MAG: HEAT repeat domain-containing protein [Planctomycetes bacterium]|nr:HEAT repeat domain-containing protein [Planctomycetota bacterium]
MVRRRVIYELSDLRPEPQTVFPLFLASLSDPDAEVRRAGAGALGVLPVDTSAATPALKALLLDPSPDVREAAAHALKGQVR